MVADDNIIPFGESKRPIEAAAEGSNQVVVKRAAKARRILICNAKGGCGKTTLATNLASFYARLEKPVALMDHDKQGSTMRWLQLRPYDQAKIHGVSAHDRNGSVTRSWLLKAPPGNAERVIIDSPAGVAGTQLIELLRDVDVVIVPVLPSPIDIHVASDYIHHILELKKQYGFTARIGAVANRVKENTLGYKTLQRFLKDLEIPFITTLRDTQNYVKAAKTGIGIHEMDSRTVAKDKEQWIALLTWIEKGLKEG